jgi:crotonobetainyl-CoA:carnitine CoA-transferase CaiB-like acyl-CoA transferase
MHAQCTGLGPYLITGDATPRTGNRSQYFAPSGIFTCKDGKQAVITCPSEKFFGNLCRALGTDWVSDPRFETIERRLENEDALEQCISDRCKEFTRDELVARLIDADVLTAPVNAVPEVTEDPQILHNRMLETVDHTRLGPIRVTGIPIHLHGTPGRVQCPPPLQGEHTREILGELGYGAEQIEDLLASGAVAAVEK